jgi:hypothetical protein
VGQALLGQAWGRCPGERPAHAVRPARYAPELKIAGVAAIAPAANIKRILEMNPAADKRLGPYVALAYSRCYPDIAFDQARRTRRWGRLLPLTRNSCTRMLC